MLLANGGYRFPWRGRACAAAVDRALGAAIKKRPGGRWFAKRLATFKVWKGGRVV